MPIEFDMKEDSPSIIRVIGVGGAGGNAVNKMYEVGIQGVDFIICNTDAQVLENSPISNKIPLGRNMSDGKGAGGNPEKGREAAERSTDDIKKALAGCQMLFITAGMGGGTGTGAAPIVAQIAKELNILTVAVITTPFRFEGQKRMKFAIEGIKNLKKHVDTMLIISNQRVIELFKALKQSEALDKANNVLLTATKGIAEIITVPGYMNVDFEDVRAVIEQGGLSVMGAAEFEGEDRSIKAVEEAISSPLLTNSNIRGAKTILLNVSSSTEHELTFEELEQITEYISDVTGEYSDLYYGSVIDETLDTKLKVTIIAIGFDDDLETVLENLEQNKPKRELKIEITNPEAVKSSSEIDRTEISTNTTEITRTPSPEQKKGLPTPPIEEKRDVINTPKKLTPEITFRYDEKQSEEPAEVSHTFEEWEARIKPKENINEKDLSEEYKRRDIIERREKIQTPEGLANELDIPAFRRKKIALFSLENVNTDYLSKIVLDDEVQTNVIRKNRFTDPQLD